MRDVERNAGGVPVRVRQWSVHENAEPDAPGRRRVQNPVGGLMQLESIVVPDPLDRLAAASLVSCHASRVAAAADLDARNGKVASPDSRIANP